MRGSRQGEVVGDEGGGSIPACAGEPSGRSQSTPPPRVYPRVCGGALRMRAASHDLPGLSPRVRGSPPLALDAIRDLGSIPACAGEPASMQLCAKLTTVYPRVCGGALSPLSGRYVTVGLSPRVRGSHSRAQVGGHNRGSIPACAGEPRPDLVSRRPARVYPRVCGGAHGIRRTCHGLKGSIPACAGEPPQVRSLPVMPQVYPRVCGGASVKYLTKVRLSSVFSCQ